MKLEIQNTAKPQEKNCWYRISTLKLYILEISNSNRNFANWV